jgi:hypothetical protein
MVSLRWMENRRQTHAGKKQRAESAGKNGRLHYASVKNLARSKPKPTTSLSDPTQ